MGKVPLHARGSLWLSLFLLLSTTACGAIDEEPLSSADVPSADGPSSPLPADPPKWLELFDRRNEKQQLSGQILLNTTQGILTLPTLAIPSPQGEGVILLETAGIKEAGRVTGDIIRLAQQETLQVPDSIELLGQTSVTVDGSLVVGEGGILIAAGESIVITGSIESAGPIELYITNPTGKLRLLGSTHSEHITIRGRGSVFINGHIHLTFTSSQTPHLGVNMYGSVEFAEDWRLRTDAEANIEVQTISKVQLTSSSGQRPSDPLANWSIEAGDIRTLAGFDGQFETLQMMAEKTIHLEPSTNLHIAGSPLVMRSPSINLGSAALIDAVDEQPVVQIEATEELVIGANVSVQASPTTCSRPSPNITVLAGIYNGEGTGSFTTTSNTSDCSTRVAAQERRGEPPLIIPEADMELQSELWISEAIVNTHTVGQWYSESINVPSGNDVQLYQRSITTPFGSLAEVLLGSSDDPDELDTPFSTPENGQTWPIPVGQPWVKLSIRLEGLNYDAPVVDHISLIWN